MRSLLSRVCAVTAAVAALAAIAPPVAAEQARLLRHPHIRGDRVVFVYAGDIWTVPVAGGQASRITSLPEGMEVFPKISPDGRWIAFSGEYAGTRGVYVVPYEGGVPKRLTYFPDVGPMPPRGGYDYVVMDWTPDGKQILSRANRTPFGEREGKYILIDPSRPGLERELQIPEGGPASLSPDGKKLAYNIKSREFRTWKRYRAGRAQDVFIYDLERDEVERVTDFEGTDNFPMWIGNSIYFTSDRDQNWKLNIWRYDLGTKAFSQVTTFDEFDVLWPSRGGDRIVFENGGYLYWLDTNSGESRRIEVILGSDKPLVRPVYKKVESNIESWTVSPSGARAAFGARGEVFTVPAEHGVARNISRSPAVREREVAWSPDGKWILYISEQTGEYEIWVRPQDGGGEERQVTKGSDSWIGGPRWSPDSKLIAYVDCRNRLWTVEVESGSRREIDSSDFGRIDGHAWSPDSRWLCYVKQDANQVSSIWVCKAEGEKPVRLTGGFTDDRDPVFSADGKYLFFVSARDFVYFEREWQDRLYIGTLSALTANPLEPLSDEEKPAAQEKADDENAEAKDEKREDKKDEKKAGAVRIETIDGEGFDRRVLALPEPPKSYRALTPVEGGIVFIVREETGSTQLRKFELEKRESETIMENIEAYQVCADGKKFIYSQRGGGYGIAALSPGQKAGEGKLDLSTMEMRIDPVIEWNQIYHDAWRIMRDWFYDPGMHGVDWKAMHDRYAVLLPHVGHRSDLDYILGEMIGELNAGHAYVFPGESPSIERVPVGMLGCRFEAEGGRWRISKIYRGANWHGGERSPLTEPGMNVEEGMYLLAIDGNDLTTEVSPYVHLENKVDVPVTVTVAGSPSGKDRRDLTVRPIASELSLYYMDWVEKNRRLVDELSGGRIGYMHVPNTWFDGYRAFFAAFQPLMDKEALIIDERYNGGGHSPYEMVEIMSRRPFNYWASRHTRLNVTPFPLNDGPKAMLINGLSSSGGDAFPFYFREAGLGPLIGEKTWGGLIGYGYSPDFVDGGGFAVPGFAFVNKDGEWDVEAVGVEPDIYVWDDPGLIVRGREPMIEKAVEYLLEELKTHPRKKVETPPGPDRSR